MEQIPVDDEIVQLDGIEKSMVEKKLLLLCEKRMGVKLIKFVQIIDFGTFKLHQETKLAS